MTPYYYKIQYLCFRKPNDFAKATSFHLYTKKCSLSYFTVEDIDNQSCSNLPPSCMVCATPRTQRVILHSCSLPKVHGLCLSGGYLMPGISCQPSHGRNTWFCIGLCEFFHNCSWIWKGSYCSGVSDCQVPQGTVGRKSMAPGVFPSLSRASHLASYTITQVFLHL